MESGMMTRVEIVTLLAHDLGHKAMAVTNSFEIFLNNVKSYSIESTILII